MFEIIIGSIAANTLILGILAFLFKSIITNWLNKDIASFKNKIEHQTKSQLAEYKSKLEEERIRLQISYGGIFEKQAETILELFKATVNIERTIVMATYAENEQSPEYKEFMDIWETFTNFYEANKILLPESVEKSFEEFRKKAYWSVRRYRRAEKQISQGSLSDRQMDRIFDRKDEAEAIIETMLPRLKKELTNKLRSLIGVHENLNIIS